MTANYTSGLKIIRADPHDETTTDMDSLGAL